MYNYEIYIIYRIHIIYISWFYHTHTYTHTHAHARTYTQYPHTRARILAYIYMQAYVSETNTHRSATAARWSNTFGMLFLPISSISLPLFSLLNVFLFLYLSPSLCFYPLHSIFFARTYTHDTCTRAHSTVYYFVYITHFFFFFTLSVHRACKNWEKYMYIKTS